MKLEKQFPDCQAWEINGSSERKLVRIEFELRASNFAAHKHDVNGCDLIVCWEDDWPNCEIERLSLKPEIPAFDLRIIQSPSRVKYPPQVWTYETFLKSVADHPDQHREFLNWAVALRGNSSVTFGEGNQLPSWSFTVCLSSGRHVTLFGVYPDGTEWLQPQAFPTARHALSRVAQKYCQ